MKLRPGSDAALDAGCICAVLDNNHGRWPPFSPDGWWITVGCPIHAPADAAIIGVVEPAEQSTSVWDDVV